MRIALFGASGATGRRVLELAGTRGVAVQAQVRPGSSLGPDLAPTVTPVVGDLRSDEDIDRTLAGCDAACLVFGPHKPYTDIFCGEATERIVARMENRGMRRIIVQTGAMVGTYPKNRSHAFEAMRRVYEWRRPGPAADRVRQEEAVRRPTLDWTILKPPRLTEALPCFRVRAGENLRVGVLSSVPRGDVAYLILSGLLDNRFRNAAVFVRRVTSRAPIHAPQVSTGLGFEAFDGLPEESQARGASPPLARVSPAGRP